MDDSCFYFGVNTLNGFDAGFFDCQNYEEIYEIIGGSLMTRDKFFLALSERLDELMMDYEMFFSWNRCCAIMCNDKKIFIADETVLLSDKKDIKIINLEDFVEPNYPRELLKIYRSDYNKNNKRCQRFLSAAYSIKNDIVRIEEANINVRKINTYTSKLWKRCGGIMKGNIGTEKKRFVSCITPDGVELNMKIFDTCERLSVIIDRSGAISTLIVDRIRRYALSSGYDVICCVCSLDGKTIEHIVIPELKFGVFSSEHYHRMLPKKERRIFASRFYNDKDEPFKNRINFSLKAYRSLMNEAFDSLANMRVSEQKICGVFNDKVDIYKAVENIVNNI